MRNEFYEFEKRIVESETIYLLVILWSIDRTCGMHINFWSWDLEILIRKYIDTEKVETWNSKNIYKKNKTA